ncbi:hypothetical protein BDV12DRAFT_194772 [Aspergillus spectabilis]
MATAAIALTILSTGGASGLDKGVTTAFLGDNSSVAICGIHWDRLAETASEWAEQYLDRFIARYADVSCISDVETLVQATTTEFGGLDILINNAAILDTFDPAGNLNINLTGPISAPKLPSTPGKTARLV